MQEYLRGRYYISPSRLYSVARLTQNRQAYEVPVAGDWVTIAVIAERGQISVSRVSAKAEADEDISDTEDGSLEALDSKTGQQESKSDTKTKKAKVAPKRKPSGRKYLTLKLVDFGHRSADSQASKAVIKGDALLNMILFEADSYSTLKDSTGLSDRVYRGGSGGAFEACAKLREGTVIAVMNAKILKPFQVCFSIKRSFIPILSHTLSQKGTNKPHPTDNVLALTPENAQSIIIIGESLDLGKCPVEKRDGKKCGSWCDRRVSDVCEYHIQRAVQSRRAARPEFSAG